MQVNSDMDRRTFIWGLGWAVDFDVKITQVIFVGNGADSGNTVEKGSY